MLISLSYSCNYAKWHFAGFSVYFQMSVSQLSPQSDQPVMWVHSGVSCVNTLFLMYPCTSDVFLCSSKTYLESRHKAQSTALRSRTKALVMQVRIIINPVATWKSDRKHVRGVPPDDILQGCLMLRNFARHKLRINRASSDSGNQNQTIYPNNGRHNLQRKLSRDWGFRACQQVPQYLARAWAIKLVMASYRRICPLKNHEDFFPFNRLRA